ncbi:MAG: prepilin-type N-terminal cleavage/methylation domain-containing protein [Verrucomicrobiales bacterium]|nr:prepilin-type N-terminal cleavage/methylation domain-containing protein [Verrucomicrobiales bacterium]
MKQQPSNSKGYTLIEALVASSILLIGIGAASSMSLAMVTREEINERANKAFNYIDNCTQLVQLGVDPAIIRTQILPDCDIISRVTIEPHAANIARLGTVQRWWIKFAYTTTEATNASIIEGAWTGGLKDTERQHGFYVYKSDHFLDGDLPRVQYVKANP